MYLTSNFIASTIIFDLRIDCRSNLQTFLLLKKFQYFKRIFFKQKASIKYKISSKKIKIQIEKKTGK